jgi:U3 small nucleolar RNA-associated protein 10
MATSLSRQLANLAVRPTGSVVAERPSLLFPVHEAKKIDLETIFNIAKEGLEDLQKHDERFSSFRETLFSDESVKINRESRTKDYNKNLDETISQYLRLLAPFFLLNPAHKTLEYLIRHYMYDLYIHKYIHLFI